MHDYNWIKVLQLILSIQKIKQCHKQRPIKFSEFLPTKKVVSLFLSDLIYDCYDNYDNKEMYLCYIV